MWTAILTVETVSQMCSQEDEASSENSSLKPIGETGLQRMLSYQMPWRC